MRYDSWVPVSKVVFSYLPIAQHLRKNLYVGITVNSHSHLTPRGISRRRSRRQNALSARPFGLQSSLIGALHQFRSLVRYLDANTAAHMMDGLIGEGSTAATLTQAHLSRDSELLGETSAEGWAQL